MFTIFSRAICLFLSAILFLNVAGCGGAAAPKGTCRSSFCPPAETSQNVAVGEAKDRNSVEGGSKKEEKKEMGSFESFSKHLFVYSAMVVLYFPLMAAGVVCGIFTLDPSCGLKKSKSPSTDQDQGEKQEKGGKKEEKK